MNIKKQHIDSLIIDYIEGRLNQQNRYDFETLMEHSQELKEYTTNFTTLWKGDVEETKNYNTQSALINFKERIYTAQAKIPVKRFGIERFTRFAAIALVLIITTIGIYQLGFQVSKNTQLHTLTSLSDGRAAVALPDGSRVWLNTSSSLRYKGELNGKTRHVFLNGEAYFEVKTDKEHPFIVNAHDIKIKATGTAFNVSAYSSDAYVKTSLLEGIVNVKSQKRHYKMIPGDIILVNKKTNNYTHRRIVQQEDVLAWRAGKIVFRNEKLGDIKGQLERAYNIKIELEKELTSIRYSGTFEDEKLEDIITIFRETLGVDATLENDTLFLKEKS